MDDPRGTSHENATRGTFKGPRGPSRTRLWPLGTVVAFHVDPRTRVDPPSDADEKSTCARNTSMRHEIHVTWRGKDNRMVHAWVLAKDENTAQAAMALAKHGSLKFMPTRQPNLWSMAMTQQAMHGCGKEHWKAIIPWTHELQNNAQPKAIIQQQHPKNGPSKTVPPNDTVENKSARTRKKRKANPPERASIYVPADESGNRKEPNDGKRTCRQECQAKHAPAPPEQHGTTIDIKSLYQEMVPPLNFMPCLETSPRGLRAQLRPYQSRGTAWMLWRERNAVEEHRKEEAASKKQAQKSQCCSITAQHICEAYGEDKVSLEEEFLFDPKTGTLLEVSDAGDQSTAADAPLHRLHTGSGGILADEMGLGKSIEVISCILLNPRSAITSPMTCLNCTGLTETNQDGRIARGSIPANSTQTSKKTASRSSDDVPSDIRSMPSTLPGFPSSDSGSAERPLSRCICGMPVLLDEEVLSCSNCGVFRHLQCIPISKKSPGLLAKSNLFVCGSCTAEACGTFAQQEASSTLIICPASILEQWRKEFERHVEPNVLKVVVYHGQSQQASAGHFLGDGLGITASELCQADVVLTTYDALRHDLHLCSETSTLRSAGVLLDVPTRGLRRVKKYKVIPTPLTRMKWWRICLDEAQMIDSPTAQAYSMALRLCCVHRWCITGTPVRRGLEDLFGLVSFLGPQLSPYSAKSAWLNLIQKPLKCSNSSGPAYLELVSLLKRIMLRRSRESVIAELALPPQGDITTYLRLSAIERHWYQKLHSQCIHKSGALLAKSRKRLQSSALSVDSFGESQQKSFESESSPATMAARAAMERAHASFQEKKINQSCIHSTTIGSLHNTSVLSVEEEKKVLAPILALRQACCHPQVGVHGIKGRVSTGNILAMTEIHDSLIEKARLEAEDVQRLLFMSLNGMAALRFLDGSIVGSIETYREVLAMSEENFKQEGLRTDPLQKLHTLHNLSLLLKEPEHAHMAKTTRDESIALEAAQLRDKYISEYKINLSQATAEYERVKKECDNLLGKHHAALNTWWVDILLNLTHEEGLRVLERLSSTMEDNWQGKPFPFSDLAGLQFTLQRDLDCIFEKRNSVQASLAKAVDVCRDPQEDEVIKSGNCERCRDYGTACVVCMNCLLDNELEEYEDLLYGKQMKSALPGRLYIDQADVGSGRNEQSSAEKCLRILKSVSKGMGIHAMDSTSITMTAKHGTPAARLLDALESLRKEYPRCRALNRSQNRYLGALDEIRMAMLRIRLRFPDETREHNGGVDPLPVHLRASRLSEDELPVLSVQYSEDIAVCKHELDRAKSQIRFLCSLRLGDDQERDCPVCQEKMEDELSVFPCGHRLCMNCTVILTKRVDSTLPFSKRAFFCPKCRHSIHVSEINYIGQKSAIVGMEIVNADAMHLLRNISSGQLEMPCVVNDLQKYLQDLDTSMTIAGSWGTKIDAVVKRVLLIQDTCPGDKILIFSEWQEVLDVVSTALHENTVHYIHVKRKKSLSNYLEMFRSREGTSVLLLPYAHGANGLNIVEAQHVVLVEPTLDPGVEAQAVKRVDRIGQTRPTFIHRFLTRGTVEENVHSVNHLRKHASNAGPNDVHHRRHMNIEEVNTLLGNFPSQSC